LLAAWETKVPTKLSFATSVIFILMVTSSAFAQKADLTTVTCTDFLKMDAADTTNVITWLQGYYTYEDDRVVVDGDKVRAKAAQIKEYCADHGGTDLVSASAIFMDKKYNASTATAVTTTAPHAPN
jgi:hypothetical protein